MREGRDPWERLHRHPLCSYRVDSHSLRWPWRIFSHLWRRRQPSHVHPRPFLRVHAHNMNGAVNSFIRTATHIAAGDHDRSHPHIFYVVYYVDNVTQIILDQLHVKGGSAPWPSAGDAADPFLPSADLLPLNPNTMHALRRGKKHGIYLLRRTPPPSLNDLMIYMLYAAGPRVSQVHNTKMVDMASRWSTWHQDGIKMVCTSRGLHNAHMIVFPAMAPRLEGPADQSGCSLRRRFYQCFTHSVSPTVGIIQILWRRAASAGGGRARR